MLRLTRQVVRIFYYLCYTKGNKMAKTISDYYKERIAQLKEELRKVYITAICHHIENGELNGRENDDFTGGQYHYTNITPVINERERLVTSETTVDYEFIDEGGMCYKESVPIDTLDNEQLSHIYLHIIDHN